MDNKDEKIKSLNKLLQGEYMAIESFNNFINRVEDEETKTTFQDIQKQHRKNAEILAGYIQNAGGRAKENLGLKGRIGDIRLNMELGSSIDYEVVKKAIDGETKGINMAEKVLRGNLDDASRNLAGEVLKQDRESIKSLEGLNYM